MGRQKTMQPREKLYSIISDIAQNYHFEPLREGPHGKLMHKNLVLMTLTYLLDRNHLLVGEPGWGKTTGAKILSARLSGIPYDLYDAMELRGNPQKYEEKIVARPHYGKLAKGVEEVVWQGTFGLDVINVDEGNRLPYDSQDVILQGIDTGRWNYQNRSLYEGKKPTFITMNERTGSHENGFLPALKDRMDLVTEEGFFTTMIIHDLNEARARVVSELCRQEYTQAALDALAKGYDDYKAVLKGRAIDGRLTRDEKEGIVGNIRGLGFDNDAMLFHQAFMAEINYSVQYGTKRRSDPASMDTHDQHYAGVSVLHSFSPRSAMAVEDYAKALAWFLGEDEAGLDHVRFVLPHVFAHKADFTDDYKNKHGNDQREDNEMIHLAKTLANEVFGRYAKTIQPMKNFIARLQKQDLSGDEMKAQKADMGDGESVSLKESDHDHPLMKDLVRQACEGEKKAFYVEG